MTAFLVIVLIVDAVALMCRPVAKLINRALGRMPKTSVCVIACVAVVCTVLARKGNVSYPATDPTTAYLRDDGSYVTNDLVHVSFTRIIVPDTATLYIDRRRVADEGDDSAWIGHLETTFADFRVPHDIQFASATNWDWIVYTTWSPGPSVQTNGVWHAVWGKDQKLHRYFIPLRTSVRVDGKVIATPKSKEDNR